MSSYLCVIGSAIIKNLELLTTNLPLVIRRFRKKSLKLVGLEYLTTSKPEAICLVAEEANRAVGFTWGYKEQASQKLDRHLEAPGLHKRISDIFFYMDEVAVMPAWQGKGIGKKLVEAICREQKQERILLRTLDGCPMFHIIKNMGGEIVQHISKGRVIMVLYIK